MAQSGLVSVLSNIRYLPMYIAADKGLNLFRCREEVAITRSLVTVRRKA